MDLSGNDHKSVLGWDFHGSMNQLVRAPGVDTSMVTNTSGSGISVASERASALRAWQVIAQSPLRRAYTLELPFRRVTIR
jgi:hypothetical protein